jgi:cyclopropane fatty-acyl-phospholipid synthase-like methyltransferase
MRDIYQDLYITTDYGLSSAGKCPGMRFYPHYRNFIIGSVLDYGCGRGETVEFLQKKGVEALGVDYIDLDNGMLVADITQKIDLYGYKTGICCDVLEHLTEAEIDSFIEKNLKKHERCIISIHTGRSYDKKHSVELHLTQKPVEWWEGKLLKHFSIEKRVCVQPQRWLIIGTKRNESIN